MKKNQLHACYVIKKIFEKLKNKNFSISIDTLFQNLSTFDVYYDFEKGEIKDSNLAVINNIISRGLPTFPSLFIESYIVNKMQIGQQHISDRTGDIYYDYDEELNDNIDLLYKSLFLIEPRNSGISESLLKFNSWEEHSGSEYEKRFFREIVTKQFGEYLLQILEPQREINSILQKSEKSMENQNNFFLQRVDFSFDFPQSEGFKDGLIIEIDGHQHKERIQRSLDSKRDDAVKKVGWEKTVRISTNEINNGIADEHIKVINKFLEHPYAKKLKDNFKNHIWNQDWGLNALQLILSPIAIARIQKVLVFLITSNILHLDRSKWKIAIIERDVPCGNLAVEDFKRLYKNLLCLKNHEITLPEIELFVLNTEEFSECILNKEVSTENVNKVINDFEADVLLDISILGRMNYLDNEIFRKKIKYRHKIIIRSSYSINPQEHRTITCTLPIKYKLKKEKISKPLTYFLQNLFRKNSFREGQVDILKRALNLQDVIALLPTGAGKSLTYQLSTLLQPGIAIIVDPLKSLMQDQNSNLKSYGIDTTVFINSTLNPKKRKIASQSMVRGFYQFVFISPERFQISEFRDYLKEINKRYFSYCVIDEAHCVSEWGHDFRTAYLKLGENAKNLCKTKVEKKIHTGEIKNEVPIIALTGTASFDVLKDIRNELNLYSYDDNLIVRPSKYKRDELEYKVVKIEKTDYTDGVPLKKIKEEIAKKKQTKVIKLLDEIANLKWDNRNHNNLNEFLNKKLNYKNSGIVFCPHASWKFGVKDIYNKFIVNHPELEDVSSYFASKLSEEIELDVIQKKFKKDELLLLFSTNAFGMGIDKPNIRFTIHFNMPQSIESFYQEAGRAGRDKLKAYNYIIYSDRKIKETFRDTEEEHTVDKSLMLSFYYNSFRGRKKEKRVLLNLFNQITYPDEKNIDNLNELVNEKFSKKLRLIYWIGDYYSKKIKGYNKRLYVNIKYPKSYGFIDLNTLDCRPEYIKENRFLDDDVAKKFVEKIYHFLLEVKNDDTPFLEWVVKQNPIPSKTGIEKTLNRMKLNETSIIPIGFKDKGFQEITDILGRNDTAWDEQLVSKASGYAFTFMDFIDNLKREYYKKTVKDLEIEENNIELIRERYKTLRDENNTFKAVYRLSVVGVIDDYEVDYRSENIFAKISRKKDEEYIQNIKNYVKRYAIKEKVNNVKNEIQNTEGNTILQKCCNYLIDYVYETVAQKRKNAINTMEDAIKNGFDDIDYFKSQINTYFDSKYLTELRAEFKENRIDTVWKFIEKVSDTDSYRHLEGACRRLLDDNPESPILLLLRSFSRFLLEININTTIEDFNSAWELIEKQKKWNRYEFFYNYIKFCDYMINHDKNSENFLQPIFLKRYANWMKEFYEEKLIGVYDVKN